MKDNMLEHLKQILDGISISSIVAAFLGFINLPNLVYLATLIWTIIRIYEMKTVQNFLGRKRRRRATDKTDSV